MQAFNYLSPVTFFYKLKCSSMQNCMSQWYMSACAWGNTGPETLPMLFFLFSCSADPKFIQIEHILFPF